MSTLHIGGSRITAPSILGNLACYYDFTDAATMTQSTAGTGAAPGNGDPVGFVNDQSGNGYHVQAVANANRPTFQTNANNGISAALFDGTNDYLERAVSDITANRSAFTIYAVVKHAANPTTREAYLTASTGNNTTARFEHGASLASADRVRVVLRRANADTVVTLNGTTPVGAGMRIGSTVMNYAGDTVDLYLDNVLQASGTPPGTSGANTQNTNGKLFVGGTGAGYFNGHLFVVLAFWAAHDAGQRRMMQDWLRRKCHI